MSLRSEIEMTAIAVLFWGLTFSYGQTVGGTIAGTVTDPSGGVVAGAQVNARNVDTGVGRTVTTNADGNYFIPFLTPGTYILQVSDPGFRTFVRENITVQVDVTVRVDAPLQLGAQNQRVVVTAQPPLLQTQSGELTSTLESKQMQDLPSLDRNYQEFISLLSGTGRPDQHYTDIGPDDTRLTSVNGLDETTNNYEIDGLDNNDVILGNTFQVPPVADIQEVHVITSNYDAEFGRAGGAVVMVQTQSGTNALHGSAYGFHRDTFLRARRAQPEEQSPPKNVNNIYGGSVGGPIIKNRTFFFGDFEGVNNRLNVTQLLSVPTPDFRAGDFSSVLGAPLGLTDPAGNAIYSGSLFDPLSGNPDGTGRLVFPGNILPTSRLNPQAAAITALLPIPNLPGLTNNYLLQVPEPRDTYFFDVRVDHKLSSNTTGFIKYDYRHVATNNFTSAGASLRPDGFLNGLGHLQAQTGSLVVTHSFGATTVGEFRFGINRFHYDYAGQAERTASDFGIQGLAPGAPLPLISFYDGSYTNVGFNPYYPLVNNQTTYQFSNTWTKAAGKHFVKWGVDVRHMNMLRASRSSNTGTYLFYNDVTRGLDDAYVNLLDITPADTFGAFLLGLPDSVTRNQLITPPDDGGNNLFLFGQDTWKISPKLTLNLGLRWEYYAPVTAGHRAGAANYDPANGELFIAGVGSVSAADGVQPYYRDFAPRFGFAYSLPHQTVLRGGYGISYTVHDGGGYGALLSTNFPNVSVNTAGVFGSSFPGGTLSQMIPLDIPQIPANGIFNPAPATQNFYSLAFDAKFPSIQSYNLTLQHELLPNLSLEIAYVGNKGTDLFDNYTELNFSPPGSGPDGGALFKKFGFQGSDLQAGLDASSIYNSLQVNMNKRFSQGFAFTAAYTWQRGLGYIHGPNFPVEFFGLGRGPDTNAQQFVLSHLVELPFGRGKPWFQSGFWAAFLGGWQYNGILSLYSGGPFSVLADPTLADGVRLARNPAEMVGSLRTLGGTGPGQSWFDTSAFTDPPVGSYGNAPAQLLFGPGFVNYDASLFRTFTVRREDKLEFRIEAFNVANTPHWGLPQSNIDQPAFGQILSDGNDARRFQFALRFTF